jgi:hypothetical protein
MPSTRGKNPDQLGQDVRNGAMQRDWLNPVRNVAEDDEPELNEGDTPYRQEIPDDDDDDDDDMYEDDDDDDDEEDDEELDQAPVLGQGVPVRGGRPMSQLEEDLNNFLDSGYVKTKVAQEALEIGGPCFSHVQYDSPDSSDVIQIDGINYPGNDLEFANGIAHICLRTNPPFIAITNETTIPVTRSIIFNKKLKFKSIRARGVHVVCEKVLLYVVLVEKPCTGVAHPRRFRFSPNRAWWKSQQHLRGQTIRGES